MIKRYVWEYMNGDEEVFEATDAVKFRIVQSKNKAELKKFLEETVLSDCVVYCDQSSFNLALDRAGKLVEAEKFEMDMDHLSSLDYAISNSRSKVHGISYGLLCSFWTTNWLISKGDQADANGWKKTFSHRWEEH